VLNGDINLPTNQPCGAHERDQQTDIQTDTQTTLLRLQQEAASYVLTAYDAD